ncbi:MAG: hypothetical protein ACON3Z_09900, partial [Bradymonadia bacterium]
GAATAFLSGSGPSVCFLVPTTVDSSALIQDAVDAFAGHGLVAEARESRFGALGARVLEFG